MEFNSTREQRQIGDAVRDFSRKELRPSYARSDRERHFARDIWKKIGELGLIGMCLGAENGGLGLDCVSQGLAAEEMAREDPNMSPSSRPCAGCASRGSGCAIRAGRIPRRRPW